ncbi:hypothetical protein ACFYWP_26530 [Actinacidiphila glaucinigra]|uniref:hypothetical protein n=1 Tax=Actinacidiphila glaucinigra TaxID=235986 RepID=UPI0036BBB2D2
MRQAYRLGGTVCAALGAAEAVWLGQDLVQFRAEGAVRVWAGLAVPVGGAPLVTSTVDLLLLGLYVAAAVASLKPGGVGILGAAAVVTLALRTPTVYLLSPSAGGGPPGLQGALLLTAGGQVAGALVLLLVVRRTGEDAPAPPRPAAGVLAGMLLLVVALIAGVLEFSRRSDPQAPLPPGFFWRTAKGGYLVGSQLGAPYEWLVWATAGLAAAAGLAAFARAPFARPLGISVAALATVTAVPVIGTSRIDAPGADDFAAAFAVGAALVVTLLLVPGDLAAVGVPGGDPYVEAEIPAAADNLSMPLYEQTAVLPVFGSYGQPPPPGPASEARAAYLQDPPQGGP